MNHPHEITSLAGVVMGISLTVYGIVRWFGIHCQQEVVMGNETQDQGYSLPDFLRDDSTGCLPLWSCPSRCDQVRENLKSQLTGNIACLIRYDVTPLRSSEGESHYRVTIYMRDYDSIVTTHKIWKIFRVVVREPDGEILSVDPPIFQGGAAS